MALATDARRASQPTQDGSWLTQVPVGNGLATVSSPRAYAQGEAVEIEPFGQWWRIVERQAVGDGA